VSGIAEEDLETRLRVLVRRELLELQADPRSPDRGQFKFVQALIREVAYNTLARKDRKAKHLAAARFFESLGSDELAGALAAQYVAAHSYAEQGAEADALAGQARISLRAAATRASSLGAHEQAGRFYEEAINVSPDRAEQAELHERAGDEGVLTGHHEAAVGHFRAAIDLDRQLGDRPATARATAALGRALITSRQTEQALELLESAGSEFADLADQEAGALLGAQVARGFFLSGDTTRAAQLADPVLATAERLDLKPVIADALITRGSALAQLGRLAEGLALLRAGQEIAERIGHAEAITRAVGNRIGYEADADPRTALEVGRAGLATMDRLGIRWPVVVGNVVWTAMRVGEWPLAMELLDSALTWDVERSDRVETLPLAIWMRAQMGEPLDELWAELQDITAGATDVYLRAGFMWGRVGMDVAAGRFGEAHSAQLKLVEDLMSGSGLPLAARFATFDRSHENAAADLAAFDAMGMHSPAFEADRLTMQAGVAALEGRTRDALALYRAAIDAWRDLGVAWDEALCELQMVRTLDPAEPEVASAAESARSIFTRLGAKTWLRFLDEWAAPAQTARGEQPADVPVAPVPAA
jgi:tetratricopeptide (TPR) repeat protein